MPRILTESDLVLPSLRALAQHDAEGLTTADLQTILREILVPEGEDLEPLEGRNDDKFSQKVRNLKSHDRLEKDGVAEYENGTYHITDLGRQFVDKFGGVDESFSLQGFSEPEKKNALQPTVEFVFVEEGQPSRVGASVKRRSRRLRQYAFGHYSDDDGKIRCCACDWEGTEAYGDVAKGLIEMHHTKPISVSGAVRKPLAAAVKDIAPLCPNCHRIVHRNRNEVMPIEVLREILADLG